MGLDTSDAELIRRAVESRLGDLYTAAVGRVVEYDEAEKTADVAPMVQRAVPRADGDTTYESLPIVPNVPVLFPSGAGFSVSWPLVPGDHVVLVTAALAFTQWRKTGETSPPGDLRLHHLANSMALPLLSRAPVPSVANCFTVEGPELRLGSVAATDFAALASRVDAGFAAVKAAIQAGVAVPNDGGANLKATILAAYNVQPTACERVKIL